MTAALLRELAAVAALDSLDADTTDESMHLWRLHVALMERAAELDPLPVPTPPASGVRLAG